MKKIIKYCDHINTKEVGGSGHYFKCYDCDKIIDRRVDKSKGENNEKDN